MWHGGATLNTNMAVPEHPNSNSPKPDDSSTTNGRAVPPNTDDPPAVPKHSPGGSSTDSTERATWSGKLEFLLSAVGFAVGLGNIWRFPHLCYKYGGGAFLIPYVLMLAVLGLPLFYLELAFGQYASLGSLTIWRICPLFKGLGYTMYTINLLVSIYYNVLIGYTLFYFFASFQSPVPWTHCGNWWNSGLCLERGANASLTSVPVTNATFGDRLHPVNETLLQTRSPAQEYWEFRVLGLNDVTNIANVGAPRWHVTLCLLLAWIIVFLCVLKGIKSSGKVVYFSATFPYVVLFILLIRGVTLEGAGEGVKTYLKPDFQIMGSVDVWKDAAIQILYSLGPGFGCLLTMGSFNKFHNNCQRDALIVATINCGTSIFAGFVIFSVLGHMAHDAGVDVRDVVDKGPGLAFVAYPEGLALMPGAPFWSLCFFFMLFNLGLDTQFAGMECIVTGLTDEFPSLFRYKLAVTLTLCVTMFLCGLPCVTSGGMYVIELLDKFSTTFPLLISVLLEVVIINWIYGFRRFSRDIETMVGFPPNYYWVACWVVVTPAVIVFILVFACIQYDGLEYQGYRYPGWAEGVGWLLALGALLMIPGWMVVRLAQVIGSCETFGLVLRDSPATLRRLDLGQLVRPSVEWGPARPEDREGVNTGTYSQMGEEGGQTADYGTDRQQILHQGAFHGDSYI